MSFRSAFTPGLKLKLPGVRLSVGSPNDEDEESSDIHKHNEKRRREKEGMMFHEMSEFEDTTLYQ